MCECMEMGGRLCAWICLSTLLLFDGTLCTLIHYSWHAEGATLGQGFGKSMPWTPHCLTAYSVSVNLCGGVRMCLFKCVWFTLEQINSFILQHQVGQK